MRYRRSSECRILKAEASNTSCPGGRVFKAIAHLLAGYNPGRRHCVLSMDMDACREWSISGGGRIFNARIHSPNNQLGAIEEGAGGIIYQMWKEQGRTVWIGLI